MSWPTAIGIGMIVVAVLWLLALFALGPACDCPACRRRHEREQE
jgi:hypothetical protein